MEQLSVTPDRLVIDKANVRKRRDRDSLESLKASILAHGVIQPLAVRPPEASDADLGGERYRVIGGGRRLEAIEQLLSEGKIDGDFAVPIVVRNDDDLAAQEVSLAENILRRQMRPVDEFRAFTELAEQGKTVAEIALRFGQSERFVRGRLALGKLHPDILQAFDDEKIGFEAATAYTATADQDAQLKHFEAGGYYASQAYHIKHALTQSSIPADSSLAGFIGEERYLSAGGVISEDLFGDDNRWSSYDVVARLKQERFQEEKDKLLEDGWSFVQSFEEYGVDYIYSVKRAAPEGTDLSEEEVQRLDELSEYLDGYYPGRASPEERAEKDELMKEYEALDARSSVFTPEQKETLGVIYSEEFCAFYYGVRSKAEVESKGSATATNVSEKDPLALTAPVKELIGQTATAALAAEVERKPDLALAMLAAMLSSYDGRTGRGTPSRIKVERIDYTDIRDNKADFKREFDRFSAMKPVELKKAIATLVATTVDLTEKWFQNSYVSDEKRETLRRECFNAFGADPVAHFDPQAFFDGSRKPVIEAAMREMTGHGSTKPKKADMATEAAEKAVETGWLPKELRSKGYKLKKS